jgi:RND family efflux transporter MFP subunit
MAQEARPRPAVHEGGRVLWAAAALLLLLILAVWLYTASRPETTTVARRDIVLLLPLSGRVVAPPMARADIGAPYSAPVARVYASVGDRVKQGDVLVELSHPTAQAAYEQARREVQAAEAAYTEARQQSSAAVAAARKELEAARAAEREARQAAAPPPAEEGAVTITEPTAAVSSAAATRIAAEQAVLQAEADQAATLAPYRQRLEAARAALREAQSGRREAMIRAPLSGTVLALNARPGQNLTADGKTPVATIVDLSELQVHAPMSAGDADGVRTGAAATIQVRQFPGERFEGKVERITTQPGGPLGVRDRYMAILSFENRQGLVKPDMDTSVSIRLGSAENVLAVPVDAVDRDNSGRPIVRALRDGRWQEVVVDPGLSDGRYTAIREGLKEGETIRVQRRLL